MANLCDTTYEMLGSKESIESLWNVLEEMGIEDGNIGLTDLAEHCDIDYKKLKYTARGEICYASYSDYVDNRYLMEIKTSTAWTGCHDVMKAIIEKAGGEDICVSYMEAEIGCEVYAIHDEQNLFPYECYVTASGRFEKLEGEYDTLNSAIEAWVKATGVSRVEDSEKMLELIEEYNEKEENDENYFSVHFFNYE